MDNDIILGLGGHIDHGKTSLIRCLNGFDGDSRPEEKQRGITLDLSFSHLYTPKRKIAFIDVPGHKRLIKHMIAGAFGIDVFLLVVALNDGIMPQSIEHLQVADALGIRQALCVITKMDLCEDLMQLEHLQQEIHTVFSAFEIQLHEIIPFSTQDLASHQYLIKVLQDLPKYPKQQASFFRYYIDRSFSLKGVGSVVSGSVSSGSIACGQKVFVCELNKELTIHSIHRDDQKVDIALPSQRVAMHLNPIASNALQRGFLLTQKGFMRGFDCIDVVLYLFADVDLHRTKVQCFIGAKRCNATVLLLHQKQGCIFATLKTDSKIFAIFKERFILRDAQRNLAYGMVLNPIADPIKKSQKIQLLDALYQDDFKKAFSLASLAHKRGFGLVASSQRFGLRHQDALEVARWIPHSFLDEKNLVLYHQESLDFLWREILLIFKKNPLALLSAKSLALKIPWASLEVLEERLQKLYEHQMIAKKDRLYISKENRIKDFDSFVQERIFELLVQAHLTPQAPYNLYDVLLIDRKLGDRALKKLCASQKVVRLEHNLFVPSQTLWYIVEEIRSLIKQKGYVDLEILRQHWDISRKYLIAYLDYLDCFEDILNDKGKRKMRYC